MHCCYAILVENRLLVTPALLAGACCSSGTLQLTLLRLGSPLVVSQGARLVCERLQHSTQHPVHAFVVQAHGAGDAATPPADTTTGAQLSLAAAGARRLAGGSSRERLVLAR